jgi:hypothetical protein
LLFCCISMSPICRLWRLAISISSNLCASITTFEA